MHSKILAVLLLFIPYNAHSAFMQFNFTFFHLHELKTLVFMLGLMVSLN
jgi:hypothetical protein